MVAGRPAEDTTLGQIDALIGDQTIDLWEENVDAATVFSQMITQWNVGPGGPVGLRYESLPIVLKTCRVPAGRRGEVIDGVRVMERAALEACRG